VFRVSSFEFRVPSLPQPQLSIKPEPKSKEVERRKEKKQKAATYFGFDVLPPRPPPFCSYFFNRALGYWAALGRFAFLRTRESSKLKNQKHKRAFQLPKKPIGAHQNQKNVAFSSPFDFFDQFLFCIFERISTSNKGSSKTWLKKWRKFFRSRQKKQLLTSLPLPSPPPTLPHSAPWSKAPPRTTNYKLPQKQKHPTS
jgi:hypothetical protein